MNEPDTTGIWILMDVCSTYEQLPETEWTEAYHTKGNLFSFMGR